MLVENGTYKGTGTGGTILTINRSGTAGAPITYEAAQGASPVIDTTNQWTGILDNGASYITIQGFNVTGDAANITLAQAQAQENNTNDPTTSSTGIDIEANGSKHPTHVTIQSNLIHDQPGGGIQVANADYVSILNNTVANNAHWDPFADSGLSVFEAYSSDSNTSSYKNIIAGNTVYGNQEYIPWHTQGKITDGNGIIVDSNNYTGYNGHTLVENNLIYDNGGTGAHAFASNNVDFLYNTAYDNNQTPSLQEGQIDGQNSSNVRIENNILAASSGGIVNENNSGVAYDYNVYSGGRVAVRGAHDIVGDPMFADASGGNFTLLAGSPAIDDASAAFPNATDNAGHLRPSGAGYDRGAFDTNLPPFRTHLTTRWC